MRSDRDPRPRAFFSARRLRTTGSSTEQAQLRTLGSNVHCNDPTPAAALPFGTTTGGLGRLERTIAIVAKHS
jgi:hypothetical protein